MLKPLDRRTLLAILLMLSMVLPGLRQSSAATLRNNSSKARPKSYSDGPQKPGANLPPPQPSSLPQGKKPLSVQAVAMSATSRDSFPNHGNGGLAVQGDVINYSVAITNSGDTDATSVVFNDLVDVNTSTLVAGSPAVLFIVSGDAYSTVGNVRLDTGTIAGSGQHVIDNDVMNGATLSGFGASQATANATVPNGTNTVTTSNGGTVTMNADGSFTYAPAAGFGATGATDSFWYTLTSNTGSGFPSGFPTGSARVTINVSSPIWFVNSAAAPGGNGSLTTPFNCYTGTTGPGQTCFSDTAADDPGDSVFLFNGNYTGGYALLNSQKLIGQGASATLASIAGVTPGPGSDALPATNGNPTNVTITTTLPATNAIPVSAGGITVRGFTVGNTTGAKIFGTAFGTLTAGNNATPDLILNGTGQAMSLTNGTFAASGFSGVTTTSSANSGITLSQVAGTVSFGSTTVSNSTTQGILVSQSTLDINFGNTSVGTATANSGGTNSVSLQNNASGVRTFGTLTIQNNTGAGQSAFLSSAGGNTVAGTTNLSGIIATAFGIDIRALAAGTSASFGATTVTKTTAGAAVNLGVSGSGNAGNVTFLSLDASNTNGDALIAAENTGTITVTNNTGSISATNGVALNITKVAAPLTPVDMDFANVSSSGATNGINLLNLSGAITATGGALTATGTVFNLSGGTVSVTYSGGITQGNNAAMVFISGGHNTGTITFQTGILSATNGTGLQFDNADGAYNFNGTNTLNGGDAGIDILNGSTGTFSFSASSTITSPTGIAFNVGSSPGSPNVTYSGSITHNTAGQRAVNVDGTTGGSISITTVTAGTTAGGVSNTGVNINNAAGSVTFTNLSLGTSGTRMTAQAVTIAGGSGAKNLGTVSIFTTGAAEGIHSTTTTGAISILSGTVNAAGAAAINIAGTSAATRTPLNVQLTSIAANGGAKGLILLNTSATGSPGGFRVNGTGTTDGSGGTIQNITTRGAEIQTADSIVLKNVNFTNANSSVDGGSAGVCDDLTITGCNSAIYLNGLTTLATFDNLNLTGTMVENGVTAIGVANFKFDNSLIDGAGNEVHESGIEAQNLSGTVTVNNTEIRFSETDAFAVTNTDTSVNLTISSSTFRDSQTVSAGGPVNINGEGGFQFRSFSVAAGQPTATINITNSSFLRLRTQAIQPFAQDDTILNIDITGCTLDAQADIGTGIDINSDDTATVNFNIVNNPTIQSRGGAAVNITSFLDSHMEGRLNNNSDIEVLGGAGIPVRLVAQETSDMIVEINGNTVSNVNGTEDTAIDVQSRFQNARVDATITNNNVTVESTGVADINLISGSSTAGESNITCGDIANNIAHGNATARAFRVRISDLSNTNRMFLEGFVEAGTATQDTEATWNARGNTPVSAAGSEVTASLTGTAVGPLAPPGGVCQAVDTPTDFLISDSSQLEKISRGNVVTPALQADVQASEIQSASQRVRPVRVVNERAAPVKSQVELQHASAHNARSTRESAVIEKSEMKSHHAKAASALTLNKPGETFTARTSENTKDKKPPKPESGGTVNLNVGTIPAGSTAVINFQVTVNGAAPQGTTQIANQGSVSGSNFATVSTDDPDTVATNDPTITQVVTPTAANGVIVGRILNDSGQPVEGAVIRLNGGQTRKTITDADGNYKFENVETGEFYTITPSRANHVFTPSQRSFNQLAERTEAAFAGAVTGDSANPLDTAEYFIRQQYVDILGREPDEGGFNYWTGRLLECASDLPCVNTRRREVAAAFFIEEEFQKGGSFIYDVYKGSLGRRPIFAEYSLDRRQIVAGPDFEAMKTAFTESFVLRAEFMQKYPTGMSAGEFVDALIQNVQLASAVDLSGERENLIARYQAGTSLVASRALVLRGVAEHDLLRLAEYNSAFVLTEYFGYLRRDPEPPGFEFWLGVLNNQEAGTFGGMVCAFINSAEYQRRFSNIVSRSDRDCVP